MTRRSAQHIAQDLDDPALGRSHTPDWHGHTLRNRGWSDRRWSSGRLWRRRRDHRHADTTGSSGSTKRRISTAQSLLSLASSTSSPEKASPKPISYEATANGWLTDHGTSPEDVGRLLDAHGTRTLRTTRNG